MKLLKNKLTIICLFLLGISLVIILIVVVKPKQINLKTRKQCQSENLIIAPMIGGITDSQTSLDNSNKIRTALNKLESNGPNGKIQVGYTMVISLLSLYKKNGKEFVIDEDKANFYINIINTVERPVVVYLMSDHFSSNSELTEYLKKDSINFMQLPNGKTPISKYFATEIQPYTLSLDENIPVNKYRFDALRYILKKLKNIDQNNSNKIRAITLNGETHHIFNDLENNTGTYDEIDMTDYSQTSVKEFKKWIQEKYTTIDNFNKTVNTNFDSFSSIIPPSQNIINTKTKELWKHFDSFANGKIPIFGWNLQKDSKDIINIYLDDKYIGKAIYGLNRLDVYQQLKEITNPNLGFRYDLDYSNLQPGNHKIDVYVGNKLLGSRIIAIKNSKNDLVNQNYYSTNILTQSTNLKGWLDFPKNNSVFLYNIYATIWENFREEQPENFIDKLYSIALESNFDKNKIYSHQLLPYFNGSWNDTLFGANETLSKTSPYNFGITLYGGLTKNILVTEKINKKNYGSPEFNPQTFKTPSYFQDSLVYQYNNCANFISPYYLGIKELETSKNGEFDLRNEQSTMGSKYFYEAIKNLSIF